MDLAAQAIYEFVWNEYCDWYLEAAKINLQSDDDAKQRGTRETLVEVLECVLRLAHPLMPFITEEIWQRTSPLVGRKGATVMTQPYPQAVSDRVDVHSEREMEWVMNFLLGVRRIRGEMNIPPGKPLPVILQNGQPTDRQWLEDSRELLVRLGRLSDIVWLETGEDAPESAIALLGDMRIMIPMKGLIDKEAELARLAKEIQRIEKELPRVEAKLNDPTFIGKAPAQVVAKEQAKLADLQSGLRQMTEQAEKIKAL